MRFLARVDVRAFLGRESRIRRRLVIDGEQITTRIRPIAPVSTKANCQLTATMAHATRGGASIDPTDAPILKNPPAKARSLAGNHTDVAFMPAGLAEPSARPSRARNPARREHRRAILAYDAVHTPPRDTGLRHLSPGPRGVLQ